MATLFKNKHIVALAQAVYQANQADQTKDLMTDVLATLLQRDNPDFDVTAFYKACGVPYHG
jgi:hypothetical protein